MVKRWFILSSLVIFAFSFSGCATGRKQANLEMQGLRNQISVLEAQIKSKDEEIQSLKDSLAKTEEKQIQEVTAAPSVSLKSSKKRAIGEIKSRPNVKQIQAALKNAGFNPGVIDGKMGKATRDAIKAFQSAHNLSADGKVGKKTWVLLREYLYKKAK